MDRFGTQGQKNVFAKRVINGMEITARRCMFVQEEEFTMKPSSNVYVQMGTSGMDMLVWFSLNVVVEKDGTKKYSSVNVLQNLIGMANSVFSV